MGCGGARPVRHTGAMRLPTGGWPLLVVVGIAVTVTVLTYVFIGRTTYRPTDTKTPAPVHHTHHRPTLRPSP